MSKDPKSNDRTPNDPTWNWTQRQLGTQQRMSEFWIAHNIERLNIAFERRMTERRKIPLLHIMISMLNFLSWGSYSMLGVITFSKFRIQNSPTELRTIQLRIIQLGNDWTSNDPTWEQLNFKRPNLVRLKFISDPNLEYDFQLWIWTSNFEKL